MKYVMFVCVGENVKLDPDERAAIPAAMDAWVAEMDGRGVRLEGHELQPVNKARTVRVRGGKVVITDGPFVEAKENIGGFDVLECTDLAEALEVASKHPVATFGAIEIRPFVDE